MSRKKNCGTDDMDTSTLTSLKELAAEQLVNRALPHATKDSSPVSHAAKASNIRIHSFLNH